MHHSFLKSPFRGGIYHLALIVISASAFNLGFFKLTGVDIIGRVFVGTSVPSQAIAIGLCAAAVIVVWNNWID